MNPIDLRISEDHTLRLTSGTATTTSANALPEEVTAFGLTNLDTSVEILINLNDADWYTIKAGESYSRLSIVTALYVKTSVGTADYNLEYTVEETNA